MGSVTADRPASSSESEIKVTPEMIEAGVQTFYENAIWGWETPGGEEMRAILTEIYTAMAKAAPKSCPGG